MCLLRFFFFWGGGWFLKVFSYFQKNAQNYESPERKHVYLERTTIITKKRTLRATRSVSLRGPQTVHSHIPYISHQHAPARSRQKLQLGSPRNRQNNADPRLTNSSLGEKKGGCTMRCGWNQTTYQSTGFDRLCPHYLPPVFQSQSPLNRLAPVSQSPDSPKPSALSPGRLGPAAWAAPLAPHGWIRPFPPPGRDRGGLGR